MGQAREEDAASVHMCTMRKASNSEGTTRGQALGGGGRAARVRGAQDGDRGAHLRHAGDLHRAVTPSVKRVCRHAAPWKSFMQPWACDFVLRVGVFFGCFSLEVWHYYLPK